MITVSFLQHLHAAGAVGVFWLYLIINLSFGALLPYRRGVRPFLFRLSSVAGRAVGRRLAGGAISPTRRSVRGMVVLAVAVVIVCVAGGFIGALGAGSLAGWVVALAFLGLTVSAAGSFRLLRRVAMQLHANNVSIAAETLAPYIGEPIPAGDAAAVARKGIEFMTLSLCRFLIAPLFWYLLCGVTGVLIYVVYSGFIPVFAQQGIARRFCRWADIVMNGVPSVLAGVLIVLSAALVRRVSGARGGFYLFTQMRRAGAGGAGAALAAMAGALNVVLSRPVRGGIDWIGPAGASARVTPDTLSRALVIQYVVILWLGVLGGAAIFAVI